MQFTKQMSRTCHFAGFLWLERHAVPSFTDLQFVWKRTVTAGILNEELLFGLPPDALPPICVPNKSQKLQCRSSVAHIRCTNEYQGLPLQFWIAHGQHVGLDNHSDSRTSRAPLVNIPKEDDSSQHRTPPSHDCRGQVRKQHSNCHGQAIPVGLTTRLRVLPGTVWSQVARGLVNPESTSQHRVLPRASQPPRGQERQERRAASTGRSLNSRKAST